MRQRELQTTVDKRRRQVSVKATKHKEGTLNAEIKQLEKKHQAYDGKFYI